MFFYSNEHEPIHIHGKFQGKESKAEIHLKNGHITKIVIIDKGSGLPPIKKKDFQEFVQNYAGDIVEKWIDFFVRQNRQKTIRISKKIKKVKNVRVIYR
jgi:CRP-like cAMP-binding protein